MGKNRTDRERPAGKPRKSVVLVEIANDWIKMVQAESKKGRVTISKVHLEPIDSDMIIADRIAAALKEKKFNRTAVLACLPRQAVNVRLLELPSTDDAEIADMVDLQIGRQTPYSRDEILSDFKPLGRTRQGTYTSVMLTIVQRSIVRERFYEIEKSGLTIERMGVSSEGVLSWFMHRPQNEKNDKALVLIDVDSFYSHLLIVQHGKLVFTKSILVGSKQLTEAGDDGLGQLSQEVQSAVRSCRSEHRDIEIDSITVSGAGVHVKGLAEFLGDALSLPCNVADCISDVKLGKEASDLGDSRYSTVSLTALIGMALNPAALEFDLVPDVVRMRKRLMNSAIANSVLGGLVMAAMVAASLYAMLSFSFKANHLKSLQQVQSEVQPAAVKVDRMIEVIREANRRQDSRFAAVNLLPYIHKCVPKNTYFEGMDIDSNGANVVLSGTSAARSDIRDLIKMLEDTSVFSEVAIDGRVTMDQGKRFKFRVVATFEEVE
jgi:Tfp pilus assembly PilM family ATPase/Tfp pilus assembly protein PilN